MDQKKADALTCIQCNASLHVDPLSDITVCEHCGANYSTAELLGETEAMRMRRMQAALDEKREAKTESINKEQEEKAEVRNFRSSKLCRAIYIFMALALLAAFACRTPVVIVVCTVQIVILAVAWLMGMHIVKSPVKNLHVALSVLGMLIAIPALMFAGNVPTASSTVSSSVSSSDYELGSYTWPTTEIGKQVPKPTMEKGYVFSESATHISMELGMLTKSEFDSYVTKCANAGFMVDYNKSDRYYSAKNAKGYSLQLSYDADKSTMDINLTAPETDSSSAASSAASSSTSSASNSAASSSASSQTADSSQVSPELKETMDDYEAFIDEYIAFMKKYQDSGDTAGMTQDYLNYLQRYTNIVKDIDAIDESELSSADSAYYTEVCARCLTKLAQASF